MRERNVQAREEYILRLQKGEEVLTTLASFCAKKGVRSGFFHALGAVEESVVGYYDLSHKAYGKKEYVEPMEVASMTGNVALVEDSPFIHAHVVLSQMSPALENLCIGGHLFSAKVAVTLEVRLVAFTEELQRTHDEEIGLKLLTL